MVAPMSTHHHHEHHESHHVATPSEIAGGSQINQILAGAFAGCFTRFLTQPFDVLKIRFQLQVEPVGSRRGLGRHAATAAASAAAAAAVSESAETAAEHGHAHGSQTQAHAQAQPKPQAASGGSANAHPTSKYTSILQACRLIRAEEGLSAFWKGHNAGQMMSISYAVFQFWSYEQFHSLLNDLPWLGQHHYLTSFLSGGLAGSVGTCVSMPFDVIRTRLVAQDHGSGYRSIPHAIPLIVRTEGVRGLFRGLGTTLVQIGPLVGGNFMIYNSLNEYAVKLLKPRDDHLPAWVHLCNGGVAGSLSKAITYPLDFIKKRLQVQGFESQRRSFGRQQVCKGIRDCFRLTVREEGVWGFYKGMTPTLLKSGIQTALYFSVYDECKQFLNTHTAW